MGSSRNSVHVVPVGDLVEHDVDTDTGCVCGPRLEPVIRTDGSCAWVLVHRSLDGREKNEEGPGYL